MKSELEEPRLGFLIDYLHQVVDRYFHKLITTDTSLDLNPAQGRLLFILWKNGSSTLNRVAHLSGYSPSTVSSMIGRLEAKGLVKRTISVQDRREVSIFLTEEGENKREEYAKISHLLWENLSDSFCEKRQAELTLILEELKQAVDNAMEQRI